MKSIFYHLAFILFINFCASVQVRGDQCFVPGGCTESSSVGFASALDEYECLGQCKDEPRCEWFTFYPDLELCTKFLNCTILDIDECQNCISGQRGCKVVEPQCNIQGECEGNIIHFEQTDTRSTCLSLCKSEPRCAWYTFFVPSTTCFLFSDCTTFDETCTDCTSGEQSCTPAYTKILVGLGSNKTSGFSDIEVIDLASPSTICKNLPDFPYKNYYAKGALAFKDKPLICGGEAEYPSACRIFEDGAWKEFHSFGGRRSGLALAKSPFQDGSTLFLAGGFNGTYLQTSKVLTKRGWQESVPLPTGVYYHCLVQYNATSVLLIGGVQFDGLRSRRSFIFNAETNVWTQAPSMIGQRNSQSCGLINKNSQSQDRRSIIVVGGSDIVSINTVEILDIGSNEWRQGPNFPFEITNSEMIEDPHGGVIMVGGKKQYDEYVDTLFRLPHAGPDATWEELPQKLKIGRAHHTALLIPDELTDCS